MKFFWWYVFGFISVLFISSFLISIRDEDGFTVVIDGTENSQSVNLPFDAEFNSANTQMANNSFVEYHVSEDILRKSTGHNLRAMYLIDENGIPVVKDFEPTQVFPVYYTPGSYLYGTSAFVPSHEESVKLSEIKSLLKKDIDPLKWSWSQQEGEMYDNRNNNIKPVDLKPIVKEDIPTTGIIPTGYFVLPKTKTYNKFQIGMIPEGYYIYDESNMAQIPPGFLASVDKTYIFSRSDSTQSMIARSNNYGPTDFTTY